MIHRIYTDDELCDAVGPHHGDRCSDGRIQSPNAQFTRECEVCKGSGLRQKKASDDMNNEPIKLVKGQEVLVKATVIRDGPDNDNDVYISMIGSNVTVNRSTAYVLPSEIIPLNQPKPIDHGAIQVGDEVTVRGSIEKKDTGEGKCLFHLGTFCVWLPSSLIASHTPTVLTPPPTAAELAKLPPVVAERVYAELLKKAGKS